MKIKFRTIINLSPLEVDSIEYCVKSGLIRQTSSVNFTPSGKLTRKQAYMILYKVCRTFGLFHEIFYELWYADTVTGKVALYHKFQQKDFKDQYAFYKDLVALDSKYFYVIGRGLFKINRKTFQCKRIDGTEEAGFCLQKRSIFQPK